MIKTQCGNVNVARHFAVAEPLTVLLYLPVCLHNVSFMNLFSASPSLLFSLPICTVSVTFGKVLLFQQNKLM